MVKGLLGARGGRGWGGAEGGDRGETTWEGDGQGFTWWVKSLTPGTAVTALDG